MKLESLGVKNFRGLHELEISFHHEVTVVVGRNGAGKTTILDAVAIMLQPLRTLWPNEQGKHNYREPAVSKKDVQIGFKDCFFRLGYTREGENAGITEAIEFRSSDSVRTPANETIGALLQRTNESNYVAPEKTLFLYYHQDRGFRSISKSQDLFNADQLQENSLQADLKAINDLESWWDKLDAQEAREVRDGNPSFRDPQLEAVRKLIQTIDSFSGLSFSSTASPAGLHLTKYDGSSVHVDQLSTGERSYIILLADLARRLQVIAPRTPLDEIQGIVLIDEIELNLHPAWQSVIIPTLRNTFKSCQFVVTTHSPQVISSVHSEHVRILNRMENGDLQVDSPLSTKGRTSNYILEGIFGAAERFPPIDRLIDKFNDAVDHDDAIAARALFQDISSNVEGQPPDLLVLKKRLKMLGRTP